MFPNSNILNLLSFQRGCGKIIYDTLLQTFLRYWDLEPNNKKHDLEEVSAKSSPSGWPLMSVLQTNSSPRFLQFSLALRGILLQKRRITNKRKWCSRWFNLNLLIPDSSPIQPLKESQFHHPKKGRQQNWEVNNLPFLQTKKLSTTRGISEPRDPQTPT